MKLKIILLFILMITTNDMLAQDWPNLKRYQEENKQLGTPDQKGQRVVFMGNSITEFWKVLYPEFFLDRDYIDRGISGQTTPQMLIRFRQDVIHLKPEVVHIMAGINDIAGNTGPSTLEMIEDNIASMCEIAKANNIKVIIASVLPAADFPWNHGVEPADKVIALNDWLKKYAQDNNFIYADYYKAMVDNNKGLPKEYSEDGVHPNKKGYELMAPLAEEAIKIALESK